MRSRLLAVLVVLLASPGCAWMLWPFRGPPPPLVEIRSADAPPLLDDFDPASLRTAIGRSISFYEREAARIFIVAGRPYSGARFAAVLRNLLLQLPDSGDPAVLDAVLRSSFRIVRATGQGHPIRFTGYYTPVLTASLERGGAYQYPIYGRPPDLMTVNVASLNPGCRCLSRLQAGRLDAGALVPYYTRAEIERDGVLENLGIEIAWTDDPVGLFFMHVQGSGQLRLPDGRHLQVNYAGTNGRPFRSIGQVLAARGLLPPGGGSMQRVRAYLAAHPRERDDILHENPRYTFFRVAETEPVGTIEVEVTGGRTIATDLALFPPGALAYIRTRVPVTNGDGTLAGWAPLQRLVLNQDSGVAIAGPARVDLYFGSGAEAGEVAGRMAAEGELYFLVPAPE